MRITIVVLVLFASGCKDDSLCARAVHRVFTITSNPDGRSKPGADEQKAIDAIETITIGKCKTEGLSQEQADCLLAMKSFEDLKNSWQCPAIKAKHPSWLLTGPTPDVPPP